MKTILEEHIEEQMEALERDFRRRMWTLREEHRRRVARVNFWCTVGYAVVIVIGTAAMAVAVWRNCK